MNIAVTRMRGVDRRKLILDMALKQANDNGFTNFTSVKLAKALKCSWSTIFHYFPTMDALRDAVMAEAIALRNTKVLLDGLTARNPVALDAPDELKELAKSLLD